jgi:TrmH family RNA methyltransferase
MKRLTSLHNNLVRRVHALQQSTRRRMQEQCMVVEGFRLVQELVATNLPVEALFFTSTFLDSQQYQIISQNLSMPSYEVTDAVFQKMADTETPQGVLALCPIPELPIRKINPLLYLVADQVRDPGNLGTMLRTAWGVGVTAVFLLPGTADYTNPKVVRAGMGAHFHTPVVKAEWDNLQTFIQQTTVWVADVDGGIPYDGVNWQADVTLVIGGEAAGAGNQTRAVAQSVHIPMQSSIESLNAAIACGVLLFEAARQRRLKANPLLE